MAPGVRLSRVWTVVEAPEWVCSLSSRLSRASDMTIVVVLQHMLIWLRLMKAAGNVLGVSAVVRSHRNVVVMLMSTRSYTPSRFAWNEI